MFVGKDFVLKHIRVKHAEKVEEYKQSVQHQPLNSCTADTVLCALISYCQLSGHLNLTHMEQVAVILSLSMCLSIPVKLKLMLNWLFQMYEDLYWQNYDTMESNRIELAKQAKREALQAAEAANREEDLEMPIELQQGSGFFPGLGAKVRVLFDSLLRIMTLLHIFGGCGDVQSRIFLFKPSSCQLKATMCRLMLCMNFIVTCGHDLCSSS